MDELYEKLQSSITALEQSQAVQQEIGVDREPDDGDSSEAEAQPSDNALEKLKIEMGSARSNDQSDDGDISSGEESLPSSQKKLKLQE